MEKHGGEALLSHFDAGRLSFDDVEFCHIDGAELAEGRYISAEEEKGTR